MNSFTNNPFAAFNPFLANSNTKSGPKPADAFSNPFGSFTNMFDMNAMQNMMPTAGNSVMGDMMKNWQKAWQNMMGDFSDNLHNPSGPFGSVAPDTPVDGLKHMASAMPGMAAVNGRLYNIDWTALAAAQKKNIEAMTAANHVIVTGMQQMIKHQADIVRDSMQTAGQMITDLMATGTPEEKLARQADIARRALDVTGKHMRELSELATQSQHDTLDRVEARLRDGLDELKKVAEDSASHFHDKVEEAAAASKANAQKVKQAAAAGGNSYAQAYDNLAQSMRQAAQTAQQAAESANMGDLLN